MADFTVGVQMRRSPQHRADREPGLLRRLWDSLRFEYCGHLDCALRYNPFHRHERERGAA